MDSHRNIIDMWNEGGSLFRIRDGEIIESDLIEIILVLRDIEEKYSNSSTIPKNVVSSTYDLWYYIQDKEEIIPENLLLKYRAFCLEVKEIIWKIYMPHSEDYANE